MINDAGDPQFNFPIFFWGGIVASTKGEENFAEKIDVAPNIVPYI